jgi:pimeloyl-ACP methyl ester carboxylesterase
MSLCPYPLCKPSLLVISKSLLGSIACVLGFTFCYESTLAWAQDKPQKDEKKDEKRGDDAEIPEQEEIDLLTVDGLEMKATYFPGTKGAESIPVILLHGFKGNRKDFTSDGLASILQAKRELGCAVIVPDLRGHGDSTKLHVTKKRTDDLKGKKLQPAQITAMVTKDLRAVKDFLWEKNNRKALNIDKLTVIGVEEGAALALSFVAYDAIGYEQGQVRYGPLKLGGFVKAAVLISPVTNIPALKLPQAMKMPEVCRDLSVMIVVGNKSKEHFLEAERLSSQFVKARPLADDDKLDSKTVWFFKKIETPLQGSKLLAESSLNLPDKILAFLESRLVKNADAKDWVWKERKLPHE